MVVEIPRILNINPPYRINWMPIEDSNNTVGSVLVYRSDDNEDTYSIVATIDGALVTYDDDSGTGSLSSHYKIQFYNTTGSSEYSDVVSYYKYHQLCTLQDVRKTAQIGNINQDLGSEEIYESIRDATQEIYNDYGKPLVRTNTSLTTGSYTYQYNTLREPSFRVDKVIIQDINWFFGSLTFDLNQSYVTFDDTTDVEDRTGYILKVEFVPWSYHILAKNMAALDLIEASKIIDGHMITTPLANKLNKTIKRIKKQFEPAVYLSTTTLTDNRLGEQITQDVL